MVHVHVFSMDSHGPCMFCAKHGQCMEFKVSEKQISSEEGLMNHCPSRDCLNFLHAAWKHAGLTFYKTWIIPGACMETFCGRTMQPPLFELKVKTFTFLHHRAHFVFTRKFLNPVENILKLLPRILQFPESLDKNLDKILTKSAKNMYDLAKSC